MKAIVAGVLYYGRVSLIPIDQWTSSSTTMFLAPPPCMGGCAQTIADVAHGLACLDQIVIDYGLGSVGLDEYLVRCHRARANINFVRVAGLSQVAPVRACPLLALRSASPLGTLVHGGPAQARAQLGDGCERPLPLHSASCARSSVFQHGCNAACRRHRASAVQGRLDICV